MELITVIITGLLRLADENDLDVFNKFYNSEKVLRSKYRIDQYLTVKRAMEEIARSIGDSKCVETNKYSMGTL
jgi:hypothetical protein